VPVYVSSSPLQVIWDLGWKDCSLLFTEGFAAPGANVSSCCLSLVLADAVAAEDAGCV